MYSLTSSNIDILSIRESNLQYIIIYIRLNVTFRSSLYFRFWYMHMGVLITKQVSTSLGAEKQKENRKEGKEISRYIENKNRDSEELLYF